MTENNTTQTSIYSQTLTEAKYLVNSGMLNPEPAKYLIHLRQQLKDRLRESRLSDRPSSLLEESCKKALKELQEAIKEVAPHGWNFEQVQMELYKAVRGDDYMRKFNNAWTEGKKSNKALIQIEYNAETDMTYVHAVELSEENKVINETRKCLREYKGDQVQNLEKWFADNSPRLFGSEVTFETPKH